MEKHGDRVEERKRKWTIKIREHRRKGSGSEGRGEKTMKMGRRGGMKQGEEKKGWVE